MEKTLKAAFGTLLFAALTSTAWASDVDMLQRSAVWVSGNYTQISNNGESYGDVLQALPVDDAFTDGERRHVFVDNDSKFNYGIGYSYHICNSQTRFFIGYDHFVDGDSSSDDYVRNIDVNPVNVGGGTTFTVGQGYVSHHADELRFGLIQTLKFTPCFDLDIAGFVEWDELKRNMNERLTYLSTGIATRNTYNRVEGWGLGVGSRARSKPFRCYPSIAFFMEGNTALIWGHNEFELTAWDASTLLYQYDPEKTDSVVGKIDLSLGVNYNHNFAQLCGLAVDITLGLKYLNMFNAFKNGNAYQNPIFLNNTGAGPGVPLDMAANLGYPNDWGRMGPFLTFAIGGSDA